MTKNPKKVEAAKRLAAHNRKKREEKKREEAHNGGMNQYYGIGALMAVGVIGGLGYYIYQTKQPLHGPGVMQQTHTQPSNLPQQLPHPKANKFELD